MAYNQSIGAWGVHQLDGVAMKIGERFIPPKKITLPISFQAKSPSDIFFSEYDFSLENSVVEHANAQKRAKEAAEQARIDAANYAASQVTIATDEAEENGDDIQDEITENDEKDVEEATATNVTLPEAAVMGSEDKMTNSTTNPFIRQTPGGVPDLRQNAVPFFGQDILTPVPINSQSASAHESDAKRGASTNKASFDLADFEREQDPFDNLEMKTLNDMVELNKVLMGAQATNSVSANNPNQTVNHFSQPQQQQQQATTTNSAVDTGAIYQKSKSNTQQPATSLESQASAGNVQISAQSVSYRAEQETVNPFNPFASTSSGVIACKSGATDPSKHLPPTSTNPFSSGYLPPISSTSFLVQQQREPLYSSHQSNTLLSSLSSFVQSNPPSTLSNSVSAVNHSSYSSNKPVGNIYSRYSPVQCPAPNNLVSGGQMLGSTGSNSPGSRSRGSTPPPHPLRSSRSTPDVTLDEERERPHFPVSHSPPPYVNRRSPSPRAYPAQSLNRYAPLPASQPPPAYDYSKSPAASTASTVPKTTLKDPYAELSWDARQLVDTITSMGFPRPRTARAVHKLGQDDKKVVDHLCLINKLVEKGFDEEQAELALHSHENNDEKAMEFLTLLSQFLQLGFAESQIKDALLQFNNDEEKTLDFLTAT